MCRTAQIIAIDRLADKLALATQFSAAHTIAACPADPVESVRELTGGGVGHAVEVVGIAVTMEQVFQMLGFEDTATVMGAAEAQVNIHATDLLLEHLLPGSEIGSTRPESTSPLPPALPGRPADTRQTPAFRVPSARSTVPWPLGYPRGDTVLTF